MEAARERAKSLGTSVNQLVRNYLEPLVVRATPRQMRPSSRRSHVPQMEILAAGNLIAAKSKSASERLGVFDTNILVYADDVSVLEKRDIAIALITRHQRQISAVLSLRVLQEYFVTATRKLGVAPETAQRKVEVLAKSKIVRFNEHDVMAAIELHRLNRISFWDARIVRAASRGWGGCALQRGFRS